MKRYLFRDVQRWFNGIGYEFEREDSCVGKYVAWSEKHEPGVQSVYQNLPEAMSEFQNKKDKSLGKI